MPKWLWIVLVIVAVLAIGTMRERGRLRAMERWVRERGFMMHSPFVPGDSPPMAALAAKLEGRNASIWGAGIEGDFDGVRLTIAEHETPATGGRADGAVSWRATATGRHGASRASSPPRPSSTSWPT